MPAIILPLIKHQLDAYGFKPEISGKHPRSKFSCAITWVMGGDCKHHDEGHKYKRDKYEDGFNKGHIQYTFHHVHAGVTVTKSGKQKATYDAVIHYAVDIKSNMHIFFCVTTHKDMAKKKHWKLWKAVSKGIKQGTIPHIYYDDAAFCNEPIRRRALINVVG